MLIQKLFFECVYSHRMQLNEKVIDNGQNINVEKKCKEIDEFLLDILQYRQPVVTSVYVKLCDV